MLINLNEPQMLGNPNLFSEQAEGMYSSVYLGKTELPEILRTIVYLDWPQEAVEILSDAISEQLQV